MKKFNLCLLLFAVFTIFPVVTLADTITNYNGVEISTEEYENFLKIYDDNYIMHMTEEKYEKLLTLDFDDITSETKYIATTYNSSLGLVTERELTEAEYESFIDDGYVQHIGGDGINLSGGSSYYETTAKKLLIILIGGNNYNYVTMTATWKYIPTTRSFDVIGFRGYGLEFRDGSQEGEQIYILNGNYTTISYSWNGTNIKRFDNGFGISMNIVNDDIDFLQLILECDVAPEIDHPTLAGSYQHAISSISLANSQNYTLGGSGLGGVFIYPYNISTKYDGMTGVGLYY